MMDMFLRSLANIFKNQHFGEHLHSVPSGRLVQSTSYHRLCALGNLEQSVRTCITHCSQAVERLSAVVQEETLDSDSVSCK